jgi:hypothetical protein
MSAIKRYMEELAEKLGKQCDEVTDQDIQDDMDRLYDKHEAVSVCKTCTDSCLECSDLDIDEKMRQYDKDMVNLCKCNNCNAILVDTNPQIDAKFYLYEGQPSTVSMTDDEGGLVGCPFCKTDGYLTDL